MNSEIFREYDIRGIAGEDITEDDVVLIGKAVGTFLIEKGKKKLSVGRDCRTTSPVYSDKIIEGLLSTGCDVINIDVCPTPVFYFSIQHLPTQGGVMVTASHNPPEYNGFKLCIDLDSIHGKEILAIRDIIEKGVFAGIRRPLNGGKGLEGVFEKDPKYFNPFLELMNQKTKGGN